MFIVLKEHLSPGPTQQQTCWRLMRTFPHINRENSNINIMASDLQILWRVETTVLLPALRNWSLPGVWVHGDSSFTRQVYNASPYLSPRGKSFTVVFRKGPSMANHYGVSHHPVTSFQGRPQVSWKLLLRFFLCPSLHSENLPGPQFLHMSDEGVRLDRQVCLGFSCVNKPRGDHTELQIPTP